MSELSAPGFMLLPVTAFTIRNPVSLVPTAAPTNHYLCHSLQRLHYALFLFISVLFSSICLFCFYFQINLSIFFNVYHLLKVFAIHTSEETSAIFASRTRNPPHPIGQISWNDVTS